GLAWGNAKTLFVTRREMRLACKSAAECDLSEIGRAFLTAGKNDQMGLLQSFLLQDLSERPAVILEDLVQVANGDAVIRGGALRSQGMIRKVLPDVGADPLEQ